MVLDVDRHPPLLWVQRWPAGDGPRHEDTTDLQAEVVVEAGGAMALDDEAAAECRRDQAGRPGRLGRPPEVALSAVFLQRHDAISLR